MYLDWLSDTKKHTLSNGLTILFHPLEQSDVAALHFCVKAGYFCETDSEVGLAHLLEHMYFKGSEKFPEPGMMGVQLKALGGMLNASTAYDQTNYYSEVPAENLIPALEIMADAFIRPLFPSDELQKECEVVIEEFNRKIDSPAAYSQELLIRLAYERHRMKRWRIGTPDQLRSYTRENLFDYFHRYYQPQNMIVTVTGNFDKALVLDRLETLVSSIPKRNLVKDFGPGEPPQQSIRYENHQATATQSYLHWGFHAPGVLREDSAALDFLCFLLSSGRSSRLHRRIVEQKGYASAVSCGYMAYEDVGLIMISAVAEAKNIRETGREIWTVLTDIKERGIAADELTKVKNKLLLHQTMQTQDALNLAELLSYYEAYGGYKRIIENLTALQQLTQDEIVLSAEKYLKLENLSALEFANEPLEEWSSDQYRQHLCSGFSAPEMALTPPLVITSGNTGRAERSNPRLVKNNVTYLLQPDPSFPFVSGGIYFSGGRNEENDENGGLTHLLYRSALKGTSQWDAEQLAFGMDALGNPPRFNCYRDYSGFLFEALPESFLQMWDLLIHCITDAQFPEKEVETEKSKILSMIKRNQDDNFVRPIQLLQRAFYGSHPYGIPETGTADSVAALSRADIVRWKERLWTSGRILVTAVGRFDPETLMSHMDAKLRELSVSTEAVEIPPVCQLPSEHQSLEIREKKQTAFALGFPACNALDPQIHTYEVLQQVLSGMGGRLFLNLRSKKSLAYTVYAACVAGIHSGMFLTYLAGETSKENDAVHGMWSELGRLKEELISPDELQHAKNALIGNYALNTQSASSRLADYVSCYVAQRPIPFLPAYRALLNQVTREDILRTAKKTFREEQSTMGIVRGVPGKTTLSP